MAAMGPRSSLDLPTDLHAYTDTGDAMPKAWRNTSIPPPPGPVFDDVLEAGPEPPPMREELPTLRDGEVRFSESEARFAESERPTEKAPPWWLAALT